MSTSKIENFQGMFFSGLHGIARGAASISISPSSSNTDYLNSDLVARIDRESDAQENIAKYLNVAMTRANGEIHGRR